MSLPANQKSKRVEILSTNEQWSYASLADGSTVKVKVVFLAAHMLLQEDGKTPVYNDDGSPQYAVNHHILTVIEAFEVVPKSTVRG